MAVRVAEINALVAGDKYVAVYTGGGLVGLGEFAVEGMMALYPQEWLLARRGVAVRLSAIDELCRTDGTNPAWALGVAGCPGPLRVSRRQQNSVKRAFLARL